MPDTLFIGKQLIMGYGYYEYEYIESNGFMSTAYAIIVTLNSVKVSQGGVTKEYKFKHENGVLSLIGDGKTLCEIELNGIKSITGVSVDSANKQLVFDIEMMDGKKEKATLDLSELIQLYNAKDGLKISDEGEISIVLHDDEEILKEDENGLYIDLVGGNGIEISGNVVSYVGSGDTRYTNEEIDGMVGDLESLIGENESGITENYGLIMILSGDVETLTDDVDKIIDELSGLTDAVIELSGKCDANAELIETCRADIDELSGYTAEMNVEISDLSEIVSGNTSEISDLRHHLDDLSGKTCEIESNFDEYKHLNDNAIGALTNSLNSVDGDSRERDEQLESALKDAIDGFANYYATKEELSSGIEQLNDTIETASGDCNSYTDSKMTELSDQLDAQYAKKSELEPYATKVDVDNANTELAESIKETKDAIESGIRDILTGYVKTQALDDYAKETELGDYAKKTELEGFASEEFVNERLAGYVMSDVIEGIEDTIHKIDERVSGIEATYVTGKDVSDEIASKLEGYDTSSDIDGKIGSMAVDLRAEIVSSIASSEDNMRKTCEDYINGQMQSLSARLTNIENRLTKLENK